MKCSECAGKYVRTHGDLEISDEYAGKFTVRNIEYLRCGGCGDRLFSPRVSEQIHHAREIALERALRKQPLDCFVSGTETARILGISRQALHKHRRIRHGFIFHTRFAGRTVYLRESVELFRLRGDGRFALWGSQISPYVTPAASSLLYVYAQFCESWTALDEQRMVFDWHAEETSLERRSYYGQREEKARSQA